MGSAQSMVKYHKIPDDEIELLDFTDKDEEISFAEKVDAKSSFSLCAMYREYLRKKKEREEEKKRIEEEKLAKEKKIKEMMLELAEIAKSTLEIEYLPLPLPEDKINEVLEKYGNIGYSKRVYNLANIEPDVGNKWNVSIDEEVDECVMILTKCVKTKCIGIYEITLKKGYGCFFKNDSDLTHLIYLITSAGINTLDVYEGNDHSYRRRHDIYGRYRGGGRGGNDGLNGFANMNAR